MLSQGAGNGETGVWCGLTTVSKEAEACSFEGLNRSNNTHA